MAVSLAVRQLVRQRADLRCEYCHADERWQFVRFTLDHVDPQSKGGEDELHNLALACRNCNERRSNCQVFSDPETQQIVPLFNPRSDRWDTHFVWSEDRLRIVGVTPTGRATVARLDFNDDNHGEIVLKIRERDLRDGLHPPPNDPLFAESNSPDNSITNEARSSSSLTLLIRGGPLDGTYEIDTRVDVSVHMANQDFPAMMYELFKGVPIGSVQRGVSPQKHLARSTGDPSDWLGIHDYRMTSRQESVMEIEYLGPVVRGQPWPLQNHQ